MGGWFLILAPFVLLGVLAGRFPRLLILVFLPIPIWWIVYKRDYGGPDDDITGIATTLFAVAEMAAFLLGAFVSYAVRKVLRGEIPRND
jgi:hypothetical protein